ncbi:DUF1657 domain-containing protein [Neobacillus sp. LXY-4]|uniref:DUF1657 domain-containing protein n=1 Tax=Neobacillus sp. LXY-4 TaxID=3379826 RepID=UPI003EE1D4CE
MTVASNVGQCLATIKGIEAQLSTLALNSLDKEAQRIFHEAMLVFEEIKQDLNERKNQLELEEPQYKKT